MVPFTTFDTGVVNVWHLTMGAQEPDWAGWWPMTHFATTEEGATDRLRTAWPKDAAHGGWLCTTTIRAGLCALHMDDVGSPGPPAFIRRLAENCGGDCYSEPWSSLLQQAQATDVLYGFQGDLSVKDPVKILSARHQGAGLVRQAATLWARKTSSSCPVVFRYPNDHEGDGEVSWMILDPAHAAAPSYWSQIEPTGR